MSRMDCLWRHLGDSCRASVVERHIVAAVAAVAVEEEVDSSHPDSEAVAHIHLDFARSPLAIEIAALETAAWVGHTVVVAVVARSWSCTSTNRIRNHRFEGA